MIIRTIITVLVLKLRIWNMDTDNNTRQHETTKQDHIDYFLIVVYYILHAHLPSVASTK